MSGLTSRNKGKRGEREAAAELGELLGVNARRGVQYHGGPGSPDVVLDGVALHVEAKRTESLSLYVAMDQAVSDAPAASVPIVWHRRSRKESLLIVRTADALAMAREMVRVADAPPKGSSERSDAGI